MTKQEIFYSWLSKIVPQSRLADCFMAIAEMESYAKKKKIISGSLFDVSNAAVIQKIANMINSDYFFRPLHKKQLRSIKESSDYLQRFLMETRKKSESTVYTPVRKPESTETTPPAPAEANKPDLFVAQEEKETEPAGTEPDASNGTDIDLGTQEKSLCVDFTGPMDFAYTKPVFISYFGDEYQETSWKAVLVRSCKLLLEDYPDVFGALCELTGQDTGSNLIFDEKNKSQHRVPAVIGQGFCIETNCSAATIVRNIRRLLDLCNVDYANLLIFYTKSNGNLSSEEMGSAAVQDKGPDQEDDKQNSGEVESDPLLSVLQRENIEYYDHRSRLGCLWVVGGKELADTIRELSAYGVRFTYKSGGGNATSGRDAWWTKDYAKSTMPEEDEDQQGAVAVENSEVDALLTGQQFAPLREALDRNDIRTLYQLKAVKLWPFMNRNNLYSIGMRQTVLEQVNGMLYPPMVMDDSRLFVLRVGDHTYKGDTPSHAFLNLCDDFTKRYPLQFRLLVGVRMRNGITIPVQKTETGDSLRRLTNLPAYIREDLSTEEVAQYAAWICGKCFETPDKINITEPSGSKEPIQPIEAPQAAEPSTPDESEQHAEPAQSEGREDSEAAVQLISEGDAVPTGETELSEGLELDPEDQPAKPRSVDPFVAKAEQAILKADIDGISYDTLKAELGITMLATRQLVAEVLHIVDINGRLIHEDAFVDWEGGAEQLDDILEKLMQKNDGYISSAQLYEYARADMNMFLNDNNMNEERAVYDMAQHLFEKVGYHGRHYKFSGKSHISSLKDDITSNLDVYRKFAADQGGVFSFAALVDYLGRIGLSTGNLRTQMRVPSEPIFFYYEDGVFMYAESMHIDDAWRNKVRKALEVLLSEVGGHIILRNLPATWLEQLPALPGGRTWTPLLLQSVLRCYSKELGARTISAMDGQSIDTLQTMLVTLDNPIQSFGDVAVAWLMDSEIEQRNFEAEELRRELVDAGIIQGNELIWNMPKALEKDERFAWDASGSRVIIEVR